LIAAVCLGVLIAACAQPPDSTSAPPSASRSQPPETATATPTARPTPTATPEPALSIDAPAVRDPREITVTVTPAVPADGDGEITVEVTNESTERIDELVLRWPTDLAESLVLAPFVPDPELVTEGGGNLIRRWTKWVIGPGEHGEPAGTTSLGYGPVEPGERLAIPLYVTRNGPGPLAFDLQVLAGEALLTQADGDPAELRVEVP
jgi:hypothetical protein